ncbi:universal stress protein [Streptomyces sp. NPDC085946]|uniref:universal stress protein n=1 Tax=Streptomyces sp. NPDC085946 TaxID=3365744 RepID=UPI0037D98642
MTGPVVVGLDGSPTSSTALWWAAREAADRNLPLLLLHSWTSRPLDVPLAQRTAEGRRLHGEQVLRRAEAELLDRRPGLTVATDLTAAPAEQALLDHSRDAALLVLGSRAYDSVASFLLGSISLHVLGLARCPAVTVRAGDPCVQEGPGRPAACRDEIVVGVQEPVPDSGQLLEFAFTTAAEDGTPVRVVRALPHAAPTAAGEDGGEAEERTLLAAALAPWREKFPEVPVVADAAVGPAARVLLSASARSRLTVVGRRRLTSRLTWKLGPVAHAALHHLPCPVAVVPHD